MANPYSTTPSNSLYSGGTQSSLYASNPFTNFASGFGGMLRNVAGVAGKSAAPVVKPVASASVAAGAALTGLLNSKSANASTPAKNTAAMSKQNVTPDSTMTGANPKQGVPPRVDIQKTLSQFLETADVAQSPSEYGAPSNALTSQAQKDFSSLLQNRGQILSQDAAQNALIQKQELDKYRTASGIDTSQYSQRTGIDTDAMQARMRTSNYYDRLSDQWDVHNAYAKRAQDQADRNTERAEEARRFNVSAALQKRAIDAPLNQRAAESAAQNRSQGELQAKQIASDEKLAQMQRYNGLYQAAGSIQPGYFSGVRLT